MTHEEFTVVTFNDCEPSGTGISIRSSKFSVVNSTKIALNIVIYYTKRIFWIGRRQTK